MVKFSIIVPVYNVEKYLDQCVNSVISQNFSDWELILVDDGSTDNSLKICYNFAEKDERIIVVHKKNGGASEARNCGLDRACGEFILFLDSDDFWNNPNALNEIDEQIKLNGSDVVIFGCTDFNMKSNEVVISRSNYNMDIIEKGSKKEILHYLLSEKMIPGGPTIFCFKRILADSNEIRFKVGIQNEDYDFVMGIFLNSTSISAINDPFYMYRQGRDDSVTGSSNIKMIYGISYTLEKWLPVAERMADEVIKKDYLNYLAFIYTTGFVVCGRMDKSQRKNALQIMKNHRAILKFGYWKKTKIIRIASGLLGNSLFSVLASKYYDKTHIQTVNR